MLEFPRCSARCLPATERACGYSGASATICTRCRRERRSAREWTCFATRSLSVGFGNEANADTDSHIVAAIGSVAGRD